ncbi:hypothetical protein HHI36_022727 [Cryptolaemus montrouzieri]|uniref:Nuclear speckle splicing regulatory protein 1 N-terminal domain-containing protein n=1 Tax=Cryptolaemus montrouzieri TaxID=559131 RepID=A0ABD2N0Q7_9CUCU
MSKEYGLILNNKNKMVVQTPGKRAAIFDEDSGSDEPESSKPNFLQPFEKKQTKIALEKAMEEDPSVYQYDEIYDDMEKKRNEQKKLSRNDLEKKPKYITNLLKAADRRKKENERRIERQVQREREAEGDEFKDKDSYITPSYKKKLEEMKALEEQEMREDYLESVGDVKKQGNLDGFYRHLFDQKVNYDEKKKEDDEESKNETPVKTENISESDEEKQEEIHEKIKPRKRQYRTREASNSDEEVQEVKKEHIPSNLDADSDFSIDSSDSEDDGPSKSKLAKEDDKNIAEKNPEMKTEKIESVSTNQESNNENENKVIKEEKVKVEKVVPKKRNIDIWKKRTVGEVFEAARKRYFDRLALRESG